MALGATALLHHPAHAAVHRAALVVEHASGRLVARCITFVENQLTGVQLIERSGVSYQMQGFGSLGEAVCQLDGEPASVPSHCFGDGPYWQYFHIANGRWVNSGTGAGSWFLHDGDMDGWHYAVGASQAPPPISFSQICVPPAAQASAAIATPTPTSAPAPSLSSSPSELPSPSVIPLAPRASPVPSARPHGPSAAESLGVLGASLLALVGLAGWNLWRRAP